MSTTAVYKIARMEFIRVMTSPLVLLAAAILIVITFLNGMGGVAILDYVGSTSNVDTAVLQGFVQVYGSTSMLLAIVAAFVSATEIPYERWNGSINVLLAKPLYRRDYILGKFTGLAAFMLLFITFIMLFTSLMVIVFFRGPQSIPEYVLRTTAYIAIFTLSCWLIIALNMLFGIVSKNVLFVTAAAMAYYFIDWVWFSERFIGALSILTPQTLLWKLIYNKDTSISLFDCLISFDRWLSGAMPYISLLIIETILLLLAGIYLFSREENN
jgi:ABC-2 type transport system permease protein